MLSTTVPKPEERKPRRVQISGGGAKSGANGTQAAVEGTATERSGEGAGDASNASEAGAATAER